MSVKHASMTIPTEPAAGREVTSKALFLYAPINNIPAIVDLDTVPFSDIPSESTALVHIPQPSRNMSKSAYRTEMASTGGFDPDAEIIVMIPELEASLNNLSTALEGLSKSLEKLDKEIQGLTDAFQDWSNSMQAMNERLDCLEAGREERARKLEQCARKMKERRARKLKEKKVQKSGDERPRKLRMAEA